MLFEQGREWSTSKLKRLSSSQAIRLTEIESDYDQRIATFEMQLKLKDSELEQKENMIKKFEDEILRQQVWPLQVLCCRLCRSGLNVHVRL